MAPLANISADCVAYRKGNSKTISIPLFKQILVQRSVFSHFVLLKDNSKEPFITTNIFRKKNSPEYKYDTKKLEKIISLLRKSWIDE